MARESILVVDDNPSNLKLMKVLLEIEHYNVRTATEAKEAIEILNTFNPQLILMDIQLPDMSGLELTQILKTDHRYKNIIILAVTAYAMKGDEEKILAAGCDGYISKPIESVSLINVIAKYLSSKIRA